MSITVEKINVLSFIITGAERLDPVRVMIENIEPGKGLLTITCFGRYRNRRRRKSNATIWEILFG
ncbi:hypothetical protein S301_14615 [Salmonella enterica subsp. enterica]|uniref:Uncharacterized protein n=1 Tax=Salmonella enterica I TaxID=59201 RepID=A0A5U3EXL4_SALET|nr:hypothetical protein [Salmonella enterica subsp. enterica]